MGVCNDGTKRHSFVAYQQPLKLQAARRANAFKVALVASDCVLLGLQPVLVHMSKNAEGGFSFNPMIVNLLTELAKTAFALAVLLALGTGRPGRPMYLSLRAFIADARHNHLLLVPAAFYAINNYLKFSMQLYFRPTTTKMLGNLKIFTIALLMRTVMRRQFSVIQYEALFLLVAGITVNQLQSCSGGREALPPGSLLPALLCVAGSVTVPSAASVYNEFALKKHMDTSVHLQNFFLYFYGALFNLAGLVITCAAKPLAGVGNLFDGLSPVTTLIIVNNAAQGILSSFFYKFADTILKKYSSTLATIFTAVMSWVMFHHPLTANFALGVSIVFVSMHQFFTFGEKSAPPPPMSPPPGDGPPMSPGGLPVKAHASDAQWRSVTLLHSPSMEHFKVESEPLQAVGIGGGGGSGGVGGSGNGYPREGSFLGRDRSFLGGSGMPPMSREGSFVPGGARLRPLAEDAEGVSDGAAAVAHSGAAVVHGGAAVAHSGVDISSAGPTATSGGESVTVGVRAPLLPR